MTSAIASSGGISLTMLSASDGMQRSDPSKMMEKLFSHIDSSGKG